MSRLRRTESVGSIAGGLWGRLDRTGAGAAKARAVSAWRTVAGDEVSAHARGFALRDRELLVFVDSAVWANELSVLSEHYRVAVNERLGKELVGAIRFAVSKKVAEVRQHEAEDGSHASSSQREKVEPGKATEIEIEQVRQMAASVSNPALRDAVIAAALAHLEWRKGLEAHNAAEKAVQRATGADSQPPP
jgi:predicted nucleic acid-binding Zn ribbon protein